MNGTLRRLGLSVAPSRLVTIDDVVRVAQLAEGLGYESIWIPETWGVDAGTVLAVLARETSRIRLASGVFNVYSRSAALIAQMTATLQGLSGGRFLLGLGSSGPIVIENWHGSHFSRPLDRTRDYVSVIRLALAGAQVDYAGETVTTSGFRLLNALDRSVPIYVAALGPRNTRLAGEIADGWLPIFAPRGHLRSPFTSLQEGMRHAGRSAETVDVAAFLPAMIGAHAERLLRQQMAYYLGGMGSFYARFLSGIGFGDDVSVVRRLWQGGDRVTAAKSVSSRLLEICTLGGDAATAQHRLGLYRSEGVALPIVAVPHGAGPSEIEETVCGLAPVPGVGGA